MGSSAKTLARLQDLIGSGAVPFGGTICDIGETQIFGEDAGDAARAFLAFCSRKDARAPAPEALSPSQQLLLGTGKFLGDLLTMAGFTYVALDIFPGKNTKLFDLNAHRPGPALEGKFDLVLNLGTTEHVFNQMRAFQSIHALSKVGGVIYHDLPMAGYPHHALFRYDPMFFDLMVEVNNYHMIARYISNGPERAVTTELVQLGMSQKSVNDVGYELMVRRVTAEPFKIPMEVGTSLAIDENLSARKDDEHVLTADGTRVDYGASLYGISFVVLTDLWLRRLRHGARRRIFGH